nr:hypothetical protein [Lysinibacillus timonensis]
MGNMKAIATFQLVGDEIYRTNTFLQFGTSRKSLGAVVMLNPGSSELQGEARKKLFMNGAFTDITSLDETMKQLIQFMKSTHSTLDGRLHIYHLFYVKKTKNRDAIELFEHLKVSGKYPTIIPPNLFEMQQHPWIMIGWGIEKKKSWVHYEQEKEKWLELISDSGIPFFGVLSKENEYYHPCPEGPDKALRLQQLVTAYNETIIQHTRI